MSTSVIFSRVSASCFETVRTEIVLALSSRCIVNAVETLERCVFSLGSSGFIETWDRVRRILYSNCQRREGLAFSLFCCVGSSRARFLFFLLVTVVKPSSSSVCSVVGGAAAAGFGAGSVLAGTELSPWLPAGCGVLPDIGAAPAGAGRIVVVLLFKAFLEVADLFFFFPLVVGTIS